MPCMQTQRDTSTLHVHKDIKAKLRKEAFKRGLTVRAVAEEKLTGKLIKK